MSDVKDILGLPRQAAGGSEEKRPTTKAPAMKVPKGMSREAFALLDQSHPIMPSVLGQLTKKAEKEKARIRSQWRWKLFKNAARADGLELYHWERIHGAPEGKMGTMGADGEYVFSKYNKKIKLYRYDDEEYRTLFSGDPSWSREETDYLMDMCERFDLRFVVIADRYNFNSGVTRRVEDLKDRYYSIARKLVISREGSEKAAAHDPIVKNPFNAEHERERKKALEIVMSRSAAQEREERVILQQAAEIEANRRLESIAMQKKAGTVKLDHVDEGVHECNYGLFEKRNNPSLCSSTGILQKPAFPGVFPRRKYTKKTAAEILAALPGGQRTQKVFEAILTEMGLPQLTAATQASCSAWIQLHVEIAELLELKKDELGSSKGANSLLPAFMEPKTPKGGADKSGGGKSQDGAAETPKQEQLVDDLPNPSGRSRRDINKRKTPSRFDDMAMMTPRSESKRSRTR
ncbi:SWR1-complex protein [Chloropicon primus]|uniref:SWR1-complex protein n=1 Tax=Chloropicon primus TaxID=1764295 RepID=A0A5B8MI64_9CHLO|nr:SWR1-complex protein [Chloropicon primus]UPQ99377.1 SWR1-complex protein [Chloropicon primus]|mmetsp:Transcript_5947/g.17876  ORF Transcript_5947/g.17876 Transcript_5947/m.17876 type:complete len:462 (+) Transcript_5947:126-1511(+)|eukprot:QDZ20166.1 SWR1-complex protein [Chloropicon primus]